MRNSESRIAEGVDVRAEGGYVIWWPREGLPVENEGCIADWPEWLLRLARIKPEATGASPASLGVGLAEWKGGTGVETHGDLRARVKAIMRQVYAAPKGRRNRMLFWAALRFGEMIARGELRLGVAARMLERGCQANGLWREDGRDQCRATIASAFHAVEREVLKEGNDG